MSGFGPNKVDVPNPDPSWIEAQAWGEICFVSGLSAFKGLAEAFHGKKEAWRAVFDSSDPPSCTFPDPWEKTLTLLQRIAVIRCLRPDKLMQVLCVSFIDLFSSYYWVGPCSHPFLPDCFFVCHFYIYIYNSDHPEVRQCHAWPKVHRTTTVRSSLDVSRFHQHDTSHLHSVSWK